VAQRLLNKVGPWVDNEDFWNREREIERLTNLLDTGHNVLLVAPRRVGKTSLLRETLRRLDERGEDYGLYVDLQKCHSPEDVVVALSLATRVYEDIWQRTLQVFRHALGELIDRIETVSADTIELKFREGAADAWAQRGDRVLSNLASMARPAVICLDELPVMLSRLLRGEAGDISPEGIRKADAFLSWLRQACGDYQKNLRFVICGSIGLEPVVARAGLSHTVGHLRSFPLEPWDRETADGCLAALAASYGLDLDAEVRQRMLDHLKWCVPHHVQMFFGHLCDDCERRGVLTVDVDAVDRVYASDMLGPRGHAELHDYEERLLRVLGPDMTPLALELLTEASVVGVLTSKAISMLTDCTLADRAERARTADAVLDVLLHDGYLIRRPGADGEFEFVSGLVRDWWERRFGRDYVRAEER